MNGMMRVLIGLIFLGILGGCETEKKTAPPARMAQLTCVVDYLPKARPDGVPVGPDKYLTVKAKCNRAPAQTELAFYLLQPGAAPRPVDAFTVKTEGESLVAQGTGARILGQAQGDGALWVVAAETGKLPAPAQLPSHAQEAEAFLSQGHRLGQWFFTFKRIRVVE